jgi:hypothetical protein
MNVCGSCLLVGLLGWQQVSRGGSGATVESGAVTLHVIQGSDRTWQVDGGNRCP